MGGSKIRDIDARLRPAQGCRQRHKQHCRKIMPSIEVSRIANVSKNPDDRFHQGSPESGKPPSESNFLFP
jgi:hypothetical protein